MMYKRIVVKIGTKVLFGDKQEFDVRVLNDLMKQIVDMKKEGIEVVVVTSGAVGMGKKLIKLDKQDCLAEKQIFNSLGQIALIDAYARVLKKRHQFCAQILVTKEDFRDERHCSNMRLCFKNLLSNNIVPIVNENNAVAVDELSFSDNDELAALLTRQLEADAMIVLTDVGGFMLDVDRGTDIIPEIKFCDIAKYRKNISHKTSGLGRGGMVTKFEVIEGLMTRGVTVYVASGKRKNVLIDLLAEKPVGTRFVP